MVGVIVLVRGSQSCFARHVNLSITTGVRCIAHDATIVCCGGARGDVVISARLCMVRILLV